MTMRAIEISEPGGPEVLRLAERPIPTPGAGEILIRIAYAGVNRPDLLQRAGSYAPPADASDIPGLECSGWVEGIGSGVDAWTIGQEVCALLPGGGYADFAIVPASHVLPVPKGMSLRDAAAVPETYFTVWSNVFMRGGLMAGERFLVHGGTSGIGTTAIQLAHAFGARVFTTAGSDEKCAVCRELGAEVAINYRQENYSQIMREHGGANLILDMVGGEYLPNNIKSLADDGRLVQIAFLQGPKVELNFAQVMVRRLTITGSTLRPQSVSAKAEIARQLKSQVWPLLEAGQIGPVFDSEFDLSEAVAAHAHMEGGSHIGKIVLNVSSNA